MGLRFLTDLREINKWIERNPFPLPKIVEALKKIEKFVSATAIDLSQGYYHIPMSKKAQKILSTIQREGESEEDHLNKIDKVLTRLEKMDFRANLRKVFHAKRN